MKKEDMIVQCTYAENTKSAEEILYESFRLFLKKELGEFANGVSHRV